MEITESQLVQAFETWEEEQRKNPEKFYSEEDKEKRTLKEYGEDCASYLWELLDNRGVYNES